MRRIASPKIGKGQPETGWAQSSLPRARRTGAHRGRILGLRYRARLRSPQSPDGGALAAPPEQRQRAWEVEEVVDNFPEEIAVLPEELRVIEMFLASVLDETFEQLGSEAARSVIDTTDYAVQQVDPVNVKAQTHER